MTTDEKIKALRANDRDKKVQWRSLSNIDGEWKTITNPVWDFYLSEYRPCPQKVTRWLPIYKRGDGTLGTGNSCRVHETEEAAEEFGSKDPRYIKSIPFEIEVPSDD